MPPTSPTQASSGSASSGMTLTVAPLRINSRVRSMPIYGLPPPPVPSNAAPIDSGNRSASLRT
jgi:hypothetical protein